MVVRLLVLKCQFLEMLASEQTKDELLCGGVEERDSLVRIRGDDAVADAGVGDS